MTNKNDLNFNDVYAQNWELVFNFVVPKVDSREDAEDITMQVFTRVSKHLPNFDPQRAKISSWLLTIANNLVIDYFRNSKSNLMVNVSDYTDDDNNESFQFEGECNTEKGIENEQLREKLIKCINSLTGLHKRVAILYLVKEEKQEDIANYLNIPIGTVKGTLSRAKTKLQLMLQSEYEMI